MTKTHDLKTVVINHVAVNYFYTREKRDINGNSRFRVYIIDPDSIGVYETIFKCYEFEIPQYIEMYIEKEIAK